MCPPRHETHSPSSESSVRAKGGEIEASGNAELDAFGDPDVEFAELDAFGDPDVEFEAIVGEAEGAPSVNSAHVGKPLVSSGKPRSLLNASGKPANTVDWYGQWPRAVSQGALGQGQRWPNVGSSQPTDASCPATRALTDKSHCYRNAYQDMLLLPREHGSRE